MDLLQHLVDVQGVGFLPLLFLLLVSRGLLLGLAGLLDCLSADFGCHLVVVVVEWVDKKSLILVDLLKNNVQSCYLTTANQRAPSISTNQRARK